MSWARSNEGRPALREIASAHQLVNPRETRGTHLDLTSWLLSLMQSATPVSQDDMHGYTVAYEREEIQFPVYVVAFVGACMATIGVAMDNIILIAIALLAF